jgi:two-component system cell cycle response regulator DivK
MDIQMPVMDGFHVVQALKGDPQTCALTVWALTSYAMPGDEDRIKAKGFDGYYTKPLDLLHLLARIAIHFGLESPRSEGR